MLYQVAPFFLNMYLYSKSSLIKWINFEYRAGIFLFLLKVKVEFQWEKQEQVWTLILKMDILILSQGM
jgi:hypothetical protein